MALSALAGFGVVVLLIVVALLIGALVIWLLNRNPKFPYPELSSGEFTVVFCPYTDNECKDPQKALTSLCATVPPYGQTNECTALSRGCNSPMGCCTIGPGRSPKAMLLREVDMIHYVTELRKLDKISPSGQRLDNPYRVRYSVYNLDMQNAITGLAAAAKAGVYIQVLIEAAQTSPCVYYNNLFPVFAAAGLKFPCWEFNDPSGNLCEGGTAPTPPTAGVTCAYNCAANLPQSCAGTMKLNPKNVKAPFPLKTADGQATMRATMAGTGWSGPTQYTMDQTKLETQPLVPILVAGCGKSYNGIMHTKMRLFNWLDRGGGRAHQLLCTGSMNPGDAAPENEETLFTFYDHPIIAEYDKIYHAVLYSCANKGLYSQKYVYHNTPAVTSDSSKITTGGIHVMFSKGDIGPSNGLTIASEILKLIRAQSEIILIFSYTLVDMNGLVAAIAEAAKSGAFVAVLTDIDMTVGEPGFAPPEGTCTARAINDIQLDAKYKGANGGAVYVPVYLCKNTNGMFSAFHHKNMVVGASRMILTTDSANWSRSAMGDGGAPVCQEDANSGKRKKETPSNTFCYEDSYCKQDNDIYGQGSGYCSAEKEGGGFEPNTKYCPSGDLEADDIKPFCDPDNLPANPTNADSSTANAETCLFIDSTQLDANKTGLKFVDTWIYLLNKYWTYSMTQLDQIANINGQRYDYGCNLGKQPDGACDGAPPSGNSVGCPAQQINWSSKEISKKGDNIQCLARTQNNTKPLLTLKKKENDTAAEGPKEYTLTVPTTIVPPRTEGPAKDFDKSIPPAQCGPECISACVACGKSQAVVLDHVYDPTTILGWIKQAVTPSGNKAYLALIENGLKQN